MMIVVSLMIVDWMMVILLFYAATCFSQQSGIAYAIGRNWMPEAAASLVFFFGAIFFAVFFGVAPETSLDTTP